MPTTTKRSLRYPTPGGVGVPADVPLDLLNLATDLEAEVGLPVQRSVLEVGQVGQSRAGRTLTLGDFTDCGLVAPVALWNLSDLTDASGNSRALTNKGSVPFGVGVEGAASTAAVFAGSTSQALYRSDTGGGDPFRIRTGSVGAWFRTAKRGASHGVISRWRTTGDLRQFALFVDSSNRMRAYGSTDGSAEVYAQGQTDVCDDRWHFAVAVYTGTAIQLYVDGVLDASSPMGGLLNPAAVPLNIGSNNGADGGTAATDPWYGRIDEAFISAEALTLEQVCHFYGVKIAHGGSTPRRASLRVTRRRRGGQIANGDFPSNPARAYNLGSGGYSELNGGTSLAAVGGGTITQAVAGPDGQADSAVNFAGAHAGLGATDAGLPSGLTTRSYGAWVCVGPHATSYQNILVWGTSANDKAGAFIDPVTGKIVFQNNGDSVLGDFVVADRTWHSVIAVEDNSAADGVKRKLYVDGKLVAGSTVMATVTLAGANALRIGADLAGLNPFIGSISRAWIHSAALTWDRVQAISQKPYLMVPQSPKDAADHVEMMNATDLIFVGDDLEPQHLIDLEVSR